MTALRILHLVAPAAYGGLESVLRALAAGHHREGHVVQVAAFVSPGTGSLAFADGVRDDGVPIEQIEVGDRAYRDERRVVGTLLDRITPDIVHTHGFRPDMVDAPVARRRAIASVSTLHGFTRKGIRGRVNEWLQMRSLRHADAVIAVSAALEGELLASNVARERVHLIPNAFANSRTLHSRQAARSSLALGEGAVVGWVGRLSHEKGADLAIEALARVTSSAVRLAIIGAGPEEPSLRALAASLAVADRVHWCGAVPDATAYFAAFDALLLSSRSEGTPIVLLEAMSAGVPIVAARVGGVPELVNEQGACLVDRGDTRAMAAGIDQTLRGEGSGERVAFASARVRDQFSTEVWLARYMDVYQRIRRQ